MLKYIVLYLPWFVFYLEWKIVRLELLTSIYDTKIAKIRTSQLLAFNMQIPVECLVVFCMSKENTGLVRPFVICTI